MSDGRIDSPIPGSTEEDPRETVVFGLTSAVIFAVGFGLLALGISWFWIVFPIGFGGVLPAALGLLKLYGDAESTEGSDTTDTQDAVDLLREQYARGEINEAEFERRLDALLETETVEDAIEYTNRETIRE